MASDLRRARRDYRRGVAPAGGASWSCFASTRPSASAASGSGRNRRASKPWRLAVQFVRNSSRLRRLVRRTTARNRGLSAASATTTPAAPRKRARATPGTWPRFRLCYSTSESALRRGLPRGPFVIGGSSWLPYYAGDALLAIDALVWHSHGVGAASQGALLATVPCRRVRARDQGQKPRRGTQRVALCRLRRAASTCWTSRRSPRACANGRGVLKCRLSNNARSLAALDGGYRPAHLCAVGFFWCANSPLREGGDSWAGAAGFLRACSRGVGGCGVRVDVGATFGRRRPRV